MPELNRRNVGWNWSKTREREDKGSCGAGSQTLGRVFGREAGEKTTPIIFFYKVIYPTILIEQAQLTSLNFLNKLTTYIIPFYFCNLLME